MVMFKRAQLFLLAAVIISAVVISLGVSVNLARITHGQKNFYDFSYTVKRETGAVVNYDIYKNIRGSDLTEFVNVIAKDIRSNNPNANFMFIYGNNSQMVLKNYGSKTIYWKIENKSNSGEETNPGKGSDSGKGYGSAGKSGSEDEGSVEGAASLVPNRLEMMGSYKNVPVPAVNFDKDMGIKVINKLDLEDATDISVWIGGNKYSFPISEYNKVIFLIQKEVRNETFVAVE